MGTKRKCYIDKQGTSIYYGYNVNRKNPNRK